MSPAKQHPMRFVVRQTGLTPHTIRVWERRHSAVTPLRTSANHRLYSDDDVNRLKLLRYLTGLGHSISQIAQLPIDQLEAMRRREEACAPVTALPEPTLPNAASVTPHLHSCFDAIQQYNAEALEHALAKAAVEMGRSVTIEKLVMPLMQQIGELWHAGALRMTHEHFATGVVRNFLWNLNETYLASPHGSQLIIATPAGQIHEMGALIAASIARKEGWRIIYLGCNLPAEEIVAAVQPQVRAIALSIGYPPDDPYLLVELTKLRRYLPPDVQILVGGRMAHAYEDALASIGAIQVKTLVDFKTRLETLRGVAFQTVMQP